MPQVTDSPLYMIASDMTFRSVATVRSLPFPYCDYFVRINTADIIEKLLVIFFNLYVISEDYNLQMILGNFPFSCGVFD